MSVMLAISRYFLVGLNNFSSLQRATQKEQACSQVGVPLVGKVY